MKEKLKRWVRSKRFWKRVIIAMVIIPTLLLGLTAFIVHHKQDALVDELMTTLNEDFTGSTEIEGSHISFFSNFPYISIDLENLKVFETKEKINKPILNIKDAFIGFNLWTVMTGQMEIKKIKLTKGHIDIVQHTNGEFNILKALTNEKEIENTDDEFHLDLKQIELKDVDITKLNEANGVKVEAFVQKAKSKFKTTNDEIHSSLNAKFVFNLIKDNDTTFLKHKHIDLSTEIDFNNETNLFTLEPTVVHLEDAEFNMEGTMDFDDDLFLDLLFTGANPNFDLLIAMAPEEIIPTLKSYENKGDLFIQTKIKGPSMNGKKPEINAVFSCKNGHILNPANNRLLKEINLSGTFTNGISKNASTMRVNFKELNAKSGKGGGVINTSLSVENFKAPDIKLKAKTEIELNFIKEFFELNDFSNVGGKLKLALNFHDIIDLKNPEHAISKLNENYDLSLIIDHAKFKHTLYQLPIKDLDLDIEMHGHEAKIEKVDLLIGSSDIHITGKVEDLPAIIHHTDTPVDTKLKIASQKINLYELTGSNENSIKEEISNMEMDFDFKASARSFTESKYLPKGEFFIEDLHANLKNYPHRLHDFHADIIIKEQDLEVKDFTGMIDKSDFHFSGILEHYEKWMDEDPGGDSNIEFNLTSDMLQLESLFAYDGENHVPEDYRHEEFDNLKIHGNVDLHFNHEFESMDLRIDKFNAKMKVHPLRFENFEGRVHFEDEHLVVEDFHGKLGHSTFKTKLHYYLGDNEDVKKRDNHFELSADRLDVDQLINYNPIPAMKNEPVDHDGGFNLYELPFTAMTYHMNIGQLNYHNYDIKNFKGNLRTTPNHYIYIEHLNMDLAGGHFNIDGYFNGSNPKQIYFSPDMTLKNVDLDQLMFKFDNFGQDHVVSENLHGKFTGKITGKIHMHTDLVPKIDDSEIHLDADVTHGRLENYSVLQYMSDYFKDKNLDKVFFDTLRNHVDMVNGEISVPKMIINSSLGHMEISGKQSLDGNMEYYLRIPWKMVTKTASSRLFGKKNKDEISDSQIDEIQYGKDKTKYVNVKITGDESGYKFSLKKDKRK